MSQRELFAKLREWPIKDLERFAAKLLVIHDSTFHGSKVIHYASGEPKKVVDQPAAATREI